MRALVWPRRFVLRWPTVLALALLVGGCATYTDRILRASQEASGANYSGAVATLDKVLDVDSDEDLPTSWGAEDALAVLERGVLQQALERYKGSARDLSAAEQTLEIIELSRDPVGAIGRYVYSDSVQPYKATPTERLALNPVNLLNYLALGDLEGAAVEARRFQVMREFLASEGNEARAQAVLGTYLSGFVFEQLGEGDRALRYYEETLDQRPLEQLSGPVHRLAESNPYRGPRLREMLEQPAPPAGPVSELLVVLCLGRVPHKIPARMPVGAAIGIAGTLVTGDVDWLKYGAAKVVVYPELVPTLSTLGNPVVRVDGREVPIEELVDMGALVRAEYDEMKPLILAAAISRLATRAAVAEGARAAGRQESGLLGDILSLLVEGALVAADRPDTRSWTMLPDRFLVARIPVEPAVHAIDVLVEGNPPAHRQVDVTAGRYAAVVVTTEPR
jgi:uncharacterized protein